MLLHTIRMLADALRDQTGGVQAQLDALNLDPLWNDGPRPAIKSIVDPTTNAAEAARRISIDWPFVAVTVTENSSALTPSERQQRRDARVPATIWYGTRTIDEDLATVETLYALDAIVESLNWLSLPGQASLRSRGQVSLINMLDLTWGPIDPFIINGSTFRGSVSVTWKARKTS